MKWLCIMSSIGLLLSGGSLFAEMSDSEEVRTEKAILSLHKSEGPGKVNIIWSECGKRLSSERAIERAHEYARAIVESVSDVEIKTGELIDTDHVVAVLFRESSHDECVIGKRETNRLIEELGRSPSKKEIMDHVRRWTSVYFSARKSCKAEARFSDPKCVAAVIGRKDSRYSGIRGWDIGVAQYRWPGYHFGRRNLVLPSGEVFERIGLNEVFDYRVSIHMLVEDLAGYKKKCRHHIHWLHSKWGKKIRKLDTEEAYFVHHHTGGTSWSEAYWKAVDKHLKTIESARMDRIADIDIDKHGSLNSGLTMREE